MLIATNTKLNKSLGILFIEIEYTAKIKNRAKNNALEKQRIKEQANTKKRKNLMYLFFDGVNNITQDTARRKLA